MFPVDNLSPDVTWLLCVLAFEQHPVPYFDMGDGLSHGQIDINPWRLSTQRRSTHEEFEWRFQLCTCKISCVLVNLCQEQFTSCVLNILSITPSFSYQGSQKPSNFLARNRRAVCGSTRPEESQRSRHENTRQGKPIPASRRREEEGGKETVVISKTYLDELLRMNSGEVGGSRSHVVVDARNVPGQQDTMQPQHSSHTAASHKNTVPNNGIPPSNHTHREQESKQPLSQHEQWLRDLSKQAEEQRKKREAEKQREKESFTEDYNPWGRPGGGAPIRSESGNLLTDYRTRGRVAEKEGKRRQEDGEHGINFCWHAHLLYHIM